MKKLLTFAASFIVAVTMSAQTVGFTVLAGCKYGEGEGCQKAMDNDLSTKWGYYGSDNDQWIYFKTTNGEKIFLTGYAFVTANDNASYGRVPKEWEIYGSNDDAVASCSTLDDYAACTWTSINYLRGDDVMQEKDFTAYYYTLNPGSTSYKYFRMKIVYGNRNGFQISEFIPSYIVDNSGVTRTGDSDDGHFNDNETYAKAVDGDNSTKWGKGGTTGTLIFHTSSAVAVRGYTFVTGGDAEYRDPSAWTLYGQTANSAPAANDANWEKIDSKSDISMTSSRNTAQHYNVENYTGKTYNYFKLYISNVKTPANNQMQFSEFMLDDGSENQIEVKSGGSGYGGWETSKLFDGNSTGTWLTSNPETYGTFVFGEKSEKARSLTGYSIQMSGVTSVKVGENNVSIHKCRPKSWSIYGSNTSTDKNDGSWQLIHHVENDTALPENTHDCAYYHLDAPSAAYKYFKFVVEETQAGESENETTRNQVAMGELVPFFTRDDQTNWLELRDETEPVFNGNPTVKNFSYSFANDKKWGTICVPFALTSDANTSYYTPSASNAQWLEFSSAATVAANQPAIFNRPAASNIPFNGTDVTLIAQPTTISKTINDWTAVGTTAATTATNAFHINGNDVNEVHLGKTASTDVKPLRAYFSNASIAGDDSYFVYNNLSKTIVVTESEDDGSDAAYTAAITAAKGNSSTDAALTALRVARKIHATDKQEDVFTGSDPVDGGQYYLYNVGAKRYLTGGVNYGTHSAVNFAAQIATLTKVAEGQFRIHTNIRKDRDWLNHNGYVDCEGDGEIWYLTKNGNGTYAIAQSSSISNNLLGYSGPTRRDNDRQVDTDCSDVNDPNNQWKFVTKEERDALMADASEENPVDATYYIHAAGYDHHLVEAEMAFPTQHWVIDLDGNSGGNTDIAGWEPDRNYETWNIAHSYTYQELTGLRPGKYILGVQGYYRHGTFENQVSDVENNNVKTDGAQMYATSAIGTFHEYLVPITSAIDKVPGYGRNSSVGYFPDDRDETVAQYFQAGLYKNTLEVYVGLDGNLKIGVEKFNNDISKDWVVLDNWRLTYLGGYVELDEEEDNGGISKTAYVVSLNRTLKKDKWNTFCVPFAMTAAQITDQLGDDAEVKALTSAVKNGDNYTMTFSDAASIEAGKPYMVKVSSNINTIEITDASGIAVNTGVLYAVTKDGVNFYGTFSSGKAPLNSFIISDNVFYLVDQEDTVNLKAFRGYITVAGAGVKALNFDFEDDATGISPLLTFPEEEEQVYNLAGQRISKMQKGVNIVNGKKVLF